MELDEISGEVIGAGIEVHRALGPGLLESAYQACLVYDIKFVGSVITSLRRSRKRNEAISPIPVNSAFPLRGHEKRSLRVSASRT